MKTLIFLSIFYLLSLACTGQSIEIVPRAGINYYGLSYLGKHNAGASDFDITKPDFAITFGGDIKYKTARLNHVLTFKSISIGASYIFGNSFYDEGFSPTWVNSRDSHGMNHFFAGYSLEKEGAKYLKAFNQRLTFHCALGAGVGANRSSEYYDSVLSPFSWGTTIGDSYEHSTISYKRKGIGLFLTGSAGINFYNKRNKNFLSLKAFWYQGLKEMAEFNVQYQYGYFSQPQYQRENQISFKTRGTVFGITAGVPIRIIK